MSVRRLPVYILADCSGSMAGDPIEQVKQGIRTLHDNLMDDPSAKETAYLSVITFDSSARQLTPLTELNKFTPPDLQAGGSTAYGAALKTLLDCVSKEVKKSAPGSEVKGDWKPLIFIFTDGEPTDSWETYADDVKQKRLGNVIAIGCGAANPDVLKRTTESVMMMTDTSAEGFKAFFAWMSSSISQTSAKIGSAGAGAGVALPPPPPTITIMP